MEGEEEAGDQEDPDGSSQEYLGGRAVLDLGGGGEEGGDQESRESDEGKAAIKHSQDESPDDVQPSQEEVRAQGVGYTLQKEEEHQRGRREGGDGGERE